MGPLVAVLLATLPCTLSKSDCVALAHAKAKPVAITVTAHAMSGHP